MSYKDANDPRAKASRRKHYHENKEAYKERAKAKAREMADFVVEVKKVPCQDCGEEYPPFVMDFDHRDPSEKVSNVSRMVKCGSWDKLKLEIAKCDIICANCHRIRTWGKT